MAAIEYTGTIDVISGFRPINGGIFPLMETHDILYSAGGIRLDALVAGFTGSIKEYIDNKIDTEKQRAEDAEASLDERITSIETDVGSDGSIDSRISTAVSNEASIRETNDNTINSNIETLAGRVKTIEDNEFIVDDEGLEFSGDYELINIIEDGDDLNDLGSEGIYYCNNAEITISNKPLEINSTFRLECKRITEYNELMQVIYANPGSIYIRYYRSSWSSWYKYSGIQVN